MIPSRLIPILQAAICDRKPIAIMGSPGIGKSALLAEIVSTIQAYAKGKTGMLAQAIAEKGCRFLLSHPCVSDPTDYKGLPGIVNGKAEFLPYGNLRELIEATIPTVVLLDDFPHAPQSVQSALMQLLLAREIDGKRISDLVTFLLAGNPTTGQTGANKVISTITSRVHSTITLTVSAQDWAKWANNNGIPTDVIAFFQLKPSALDYLTSKVPTEKAIAEKAMKESQPFCCPRTAEFAGRWIAQGIDDPEVINGCIGEGVGTESLAFRTLYKSIGYIIPAILSNPKSADVFEQMDRNFAIAASLTYHASVKNIDNVSAYMERVSGEFRTFFWKVATARKPELQKTNAYTSYFAAHSDEIQ